MYLIWILCNGPILNSPSGRGDGELRGQQEELLVAPGGILPLRRTNVCVFLFKRRKKNNGVFRRKTHFKSQLIQINSFLNVRLIMYIFLIY